MMGGRALGRQMSMGQGKRLSARALLGAFGPMGLSAVLFDLQRKIDADQLQAAQVRPPKQSRHACSTHSLKVVTTPSGSTTYTLRAHNKRCTSSWLLTLTLQPFFSFELHAKKAWASL